jgi:uncharacterized protein (DUF433 family)
MGKRSTEEAEEDYQYVPLGKYVVCAPSVCRGRPTFKNTRIEVAGVLERLGAGHTIEELVTGYQGRISEPAIQEAIALAAKALVKHAPTAVAS